MGGCFKIDEGLNPTVMQASKLLPQSDIQKLIYLPRADGRLSCLLQGAERSQESFDSKFKAGLSVGPLFCHSVILLPDLES